MRLAVSSRSVMSANPAKRSLTGPILIATPPLYLSSPRSSVSSVPGRHLASCGMSFKNSHTASIGCATSNSFLINMSRLLVNVGWFGQVRCRSSAVRPHRWRARDVMLLSQRLKYPVGQHRHVDVAHSSALERIHDSVDEGRRPTDRRALADTLRADGVVWAGSDDLVQLVARSLPG